MDEEGDDHTPATVAAPAAGAAALPTARHSTGADEAMASAKAAPRTPDVSKRRPARGMVTYAPSAGTATEAVVATKPERMGGAPASEAWRAQQGRTGVRKDRGAAPPAHGGSLSLPRTDAKKTWIASMTVSIPPGTRESGRASCVSDHRPGPHASSVSEMTKETAASEEPLSTIAAPSPAARMGRLSLAVPSKSVDQSGVADGDGDQPTESVCVGESDGEGLPVRDCVALPEAVVERVRDVEGEMLPVWDRVAVPESVAEVEGVAEDEAEAVAVTVAEPVDVGELAKDKHNSTI